MIHKTAKFLFESVMKNLLLLLSCITFFNVQAQTLTSLDFEDDLESVQKVDSVEVDDLAHLKSLSKKRFSSSEKSNYVARLIKKADAYFDKMWYAEASELYDIALKKDLKNASSRVLQRAGDSHYFNSNMEKAYYWYAKLFEIHQQDLTDSDYFRYAHVLKGTGRYKKAKRLVAIFNKKKEVEELAAAKEQLQKIKAEDYIKNIEIKNLNINSKYSEFAPMFHEGENLVYASSKDSAFLKTRRYKWNNQPFLDLYEGTVGENSSLVQNVKKLHKNVNSKYHEAGVAFSPDQNTIYFTRNNFSKKLKRAKNGINHLKIYRSEKIDGEWSKAKELSFNSEDYSTGHPAMSVDGKKLYFVSDRPGGYGGTDIYVVDINEDGTFSTPMNLGKEINSNRREMFPYVTKKTLTFSSDRQMGLGGLDIYEAKLVNDAFGAPTNLGKPINSIRDDFSYIAVESGETGYFASNRKGGKGDDDIYSFKKLPVEKVEEEKTSIVGLVTELLTGEPLTNAQVVLLDKDENVVQQIESNADGTFRFEDLPQNSTYTIATADPDYFADSQTIATTEEDEVNVTISLKKLDDVIVVENDIKKLKTDKIYFNFDKSSIRPDAKKELDKLLEVWEKYPDMVIKIESHTDAIGPAAYNRYLSDKRAKATRDYLISKGIDASKIYSAIGYGEQYPINDCSDGVRCERSKHQENRRSEFIIMSM
ncbi:OmpA family protein [Croceitalea sp. MTPC5]|nr:OmpA family protein [Croceitalea sp. MTPC5]